MIWTDTRQVSAGLKHVLHQLRGTFATLTQFRNWPTRSYWETHAPKIPLDSARRLFYQAWYKVKRFSHGDNKLNVAMSTFLRARYAQYPDIRDPWLVRSSYRPRFPTSTHAVYHPNKFSDRSSPSILVLNTENTQLSHIVVAGLEPFASGINIKWSDYRTKWRRASIFPLPLTNLFYLVNPKIERRDVLRPHVAVVSNATQRCEPGHLLCPQSIGAKDEHPCLR